MHQDMFADPERATKKEHVIAALLDNPSIKEAFLE
jgi:hypothetical protein